MNSATGIFDLHVKPTYAVLVPQREQKQNYKTVARIKAEKHLKNNALTGELSKKATRRLVNAINWLVASAKTKYIFDKETGKRFSFKINFVTLTLPTIDHGITDHEFKKTLLHNFINTCRYKFDLKNFVWKVETQENGNIHAHFTTDTFIHWKDLRKVWNTILEKRGIIQHYTDKHKNLTLEEYSKLYNPDNKKDYEQVKKAFLFGQATNWKDPNTTDVHAVHKVKDIGAYMAKYMSKKEEGRRVIKGRIWGCSHNLSENNKLTIEICGTEDYDYIQEFHKQEILYKPIQIESKLSSQLTTVGEMYFFKLIDWGTLLKGRLLAKFNEHRFNIRHNIDVTRLKGILVPENNLTTLITPIT
jgi:hypothetical protein